MVAHNYTFGISKVHGTNNIWEVTSKRSLLGFGGRDYDGRRRLCTCDTENNAKIIVDALIEKYK